MLSKKFVAVTLLATVLAFFVFSMPFCSCATVTQGDAMSAIVAAQSKLVVCYRAVANASDAGANVTGLIQVLDEAGGNLSRAYLAYNMGNFSSAQSYAVQSLNLLVQNNIPARANTLQSSAYLASFWSAMITVLVTLVGVVVVFCGGIVLWVLLKRRYEKTGVRPNKA